MTSNIVALAPPARDPQPAELLDLFDYLNGEERTRLIDWADGLADRRRLTQDERDVKRYHHLLDLLDREQVPPCHGHIWRVIEADLRADLIDRGLLETPAAIRWAGKPTSR